MHNRRKILNAKLPEYILVADKPPRLSGKIEKITPADFQQRTQIVLDESTYQDNSLKKEDMKFGCLFQGEAYGSYPEIKKYLAGQHDHLVLCNMGNYGYGVFAASTITYGTVVSIYSGTIVSRDEKQLTTDECFAFNDSNFQFSCRYSRGISSFMQHLPSTPQGSTAQEHADFFNNLHPANHATVEETECEVELLGMEFRKPAIRASVATQNVERVFLTYKSVPIVAIIAMRTIYQGDQFGFSYGYSYWNNRNITPELFNLKGAVIPRLDYLRTHGAMVFKKEVKKGDLRPMIEEIKRQNPRVVHYNDYNNNPQVMATEKVILRLFNMNAVRLVQNVKALPEKIKLVAGDKSLVKMIDLTTLAQQKFFYELRMALGNMVIPSLAFAPVYEISIDWVRQVYLHNTEAFMPLLLNLDITLEEIFPVNKMQRSVRPTGN
jgi:hypothetical protein